MVFVVAPSEAGVRADVFVVSRYPEFSRSALGILFERNLVKANGKVAQPSHKLKADDNVAVDDELLFAEHPIDIPVLYEDDDVIVMDKPAGVLTHSKGSFNDEATVASFIKPKLAAELTGNRAGIAHRLDRGTSGLIIAAKNNQALRFLQKQFSTRKVAKTYIAHAEGTPKPADGLVDAPIARNPRNPKTFRVDPRGKAAVTAYKVLGSSNGKSLIELKPKTGRTHQLRVHLSYMGHPIVGDQLYNRNAGPERLMLHASELKLALPSGQHQTFTSKLPKEFDLK